MTNTNNEAQSFDEYQKVEKALLPYIEGGRRGDGSMATSTFYDHTHIVGSIGGDFYNMTKQDFVGAVDSGGPSDDLKARIVWIDISGPAAAAKVEFLNWNGLRFTDFFVLYKQGKEWKISGKVYDSHTNN